MGLHWGYQEEATESQTEKRTTFGGGFLLMLIMNLHTPGATLQKEARWIIQIRA